MIKYFVFFCCLFTLLTRAQIQEDAWVYFRDKPHATAFLEAPQRMLSPKALDRRQRQNILITIDDVPVYPVYVTAVTNGDVQVLSRSKWLNALHVQGTQQQINALADLSFVREIIFANRSLTGTGRMQESEVLNPVAAPKNFAAVQRNDVQPLQNQQLELPFLHQLNYTGSGVDIAIMDAGFPGVDTQSPFASLHQNNQIGSTYDFVSRSPFVYHKSNHGTMVLSTMGVTVPNQFVGSAPEAKYHLFITEDYMRETPLEESLWVEALEKADSIGVSIVNTSLGYTTFDRSEYNYQYADLNGSTTFSSKGAIHAKATGMLLVNSAGNWGSAGWYYIGTPSDSPGVLTVAAVNSSGVRSNFSSYGPAADGRLKPEVAALGSQAQVYNENGMFTAVNGTSFSAPILAGAIGCLWQAFPNKTVDELLDIVKRSSHQYQTPDVSLGYGIPNFRTAYNASLNTAIYQVSKATVFPNPFADDVIFKWHNNETEGIVKVFNNLGQIVQESRVIENQLLHLGALKPGIYIYELQLSDAVYTGKIIKK